MAIASLKEFEKKTKDYLNELKEEVKRFERVVNNTNDKLRWEGASYVLDSISKSAESVAKAMRDFQNNLKMGKVEESVKPIRKSFKQYLAESKHDIISVPSLHGFCITNGAKSVISGKDGKPLVFDDIDRAKEYIKNISEGCSIKESVLPTDNEGWGFFGTSLDHVDGTPKAEMFWEIASKVLAKERGWNPVKVRDWLDSKSGRHFADTVSDFGWSEGGIKNAYRKWDSMGWFDK